MTPKENIFMTTVPFLFGGQYLYFHLYCFEVEGEITLTNYP